jgi:hypothetical protein
MGKQLTTEQFIQKAKSIHEDKYDYSDVNYIGYKNKIKIRCSKHGVFEQLVVNHLQGCGCPNCGGNKKLTTEQFIQKAKSIHEDKYDYSLVDYQGTKRKVKIICKKHGIFEQRPDQHINKKHNCPQCKKTTTEQFIQKAKSVHGDKYDYSLVKYVNSRTKVKILCKKHGIFEQNPDNHIQKQGCPKCLNISNTKPEQIIAEYLKEHNIQFIQNDRTTIKNPETNRWLELDFYLPEYNIAIEINGRYWHEIKKDTTKKRKLKTKLCKEKDIDLYHIWDTEVKNIINTNKN